MGLRFDGRDMAALPSRRLRSQASRLRTRSIARRAPAARRQRSARGQPQSPMAGPPEKRRPAARRPQGPSWRGYWPARRQASCSTSTPRRTGPPCTGSLQDGPGGHRVEAAGRQHCAAIAVELCSFDLCRGVRGGTLETPSPVLNFRTSHTRRDSVITAAV